MGSVFFEIVPAGTSPPRRFIELRQERLEVPQNEATE